MQGGLLSATRKEDTYLEKLMRQIRGKVSISHFLRLENNSLCGRDRGSEGRGDSQK